MKRITPLIGLLVYFLSSWGQTSMQLSFAANPSISWMNTTSKEVSRERAVLGYDFGILGDIFFTENERYALHTGLLVINTGGVLTYRSDQPFTFAGEPMDPMSEIKFRLRYLEVPLSIKLKTDEYHRMYYWGIFGLSPMINIGANGTAEDGTFKRASIHEEVSLFNLAMNVGVGFDFDLGGNNSASAGLIFQNGLTDVTTDNEFNDKTILNSLKVRLALIF